MLLTEFGNNRKPRDIPAFTASFSSAKDLGDGEIIKFDKVWTNNKNGYNPNTGVFTAPKTGLYQVSATIMSSHKKPLLAYLWQNDVRMVSLYSGTGYNEATANMVLNLKKDDRIYLKVRGGSGAIYGHLEKPYSMFSGYLISE